MTSKCLGWANDRSPLRGLGHWKLICSRSLVGNHEVNSCLVNPSKLPSRENQDGDGQQQGGVNQRIEHIAQQGH